MKSYIKKKSVSFEKMMFLHFLINWAVKGKALFTGQRHENFIFDLKNYFFYLEIVNRFSKYDFFTSPIYCIYSIH